MTSTWPCWIIEQGHCQTLACPQLNFSWVVDWEMICLWWKACFNQQATTSRKSPGSWKRLKKVGRIVMKELQPGTKVRMQPWTNSTVVKYQHTPKSYVVQAELGRKYRSNRRHRRVCPAPGYDSLNRELPLGVDKTVVQYKEPARDAESDQPTTPIMLPDIPS